MTRKNGNGREEVLSGPPAGPPKGIANPEHWEQDFDNMPFWSIAEKIYEIPDTDDMAGVIIRAGIKDEHLENAMIRNSHRHEKFGNIPGQKMLRMKAAACAGRNGRARLEVLFGITRLFAPDSYRVVTGMPRKKNGDEPVHRGSDFREKVDDNGGNK